MPSIPLETASQRLHKKQQSNNHIIYNKVKTVYRTQGTCSSAIELEVDDNHIIQSVSFIGGCPGNTQGVSMLVRGAKAEDVINRLQGIRCGYKSTSCPDQLSCALTEAIQKVEEDKKNRL
jgi:uncharacterized protein (TIGR03905 family)